MTSSGRPPASPSAHNTGTIGAGALAATGGPGTGKGGPPGVPQLPSSVRPLHGEGDLFSPSLPCFLAPAKVSQQSVQSPESAGSGPGGREAAGDTVSQPDELSPPAQLHAGAQALHWVAHSTRSHRKSHSHAGVSAASAGGNSFRTSFMNRVMSHISPSAGGCRMPGGAPSSLPPICRAPVVAVGAGPPIAAAASGQGRRPLDLLQPLPRQRQPAQAVSSGPAHGAGRSTALHGAPPLDTTTGGRRSPCHAGNRAVAAAEAQQRRARLPPLQHRLSGVPSPQGPTAWTSVTPDARHCAVASGRLARGGSGLSTAVSANPKPGGGSSTAGGIYAPAMPPDGRSVSQIQLPSLNATHLSAASLRPVPRHATSAPIAASALQRAEARGGANQALPKPSLQPGRGQGLGRGQSVSMQDYPGVQCWQEL
jgi:hypothetical protein